LTLLICNSEKTVTDREESLLALSAISRKREEALDSSRGLRKRSE
jgi:hypothetical protein